MLENNRRRVQSLTGAEIWMFIVGRSLLAFGVGILAMMYFPEASTALAWPALALGLVLFLVASRGLTRTNPDDPTA